jgi:transcription antitermination protein NusB
MNRRLLRETIIKLIYQDIIGGGFIEGDYSEEVLKQFNQVRDEYSKIDTLIQDNLTNWSLDRLNYVDLAIVRYSVYELKYLNIPFEIVVNEALEITKKYSNLDDDLARKFNNRLLQNIKNALEKENG